MSVTDEVRAAAREVAALFRDNYMVPNTWPPVRRFLAAVEALDGPATADGPQTSSQSSAGATDATAAGTDSPAPATVDAPADPLPQDTPLRQSRAPLT